MESSNASEDQPIIVRSHVTKLTLPLPQDILSAFRNGYVLNYIASGGITQRLALGSEPLDAESLVRLFKFYEDYDKGALNFYEYTAFLDQLKTKGFLRQGEVV